MSDITVDPTLTKPGTGATYKDGFAGSAVLQGQPVYEDIADGKKWKPADANLSAAGAAAIGIALNSASLDQPLKIQVTGIITIGGTVVVAAIYVVSANAGGICPSADAASGHFCTIIGVGMTSTTISLGIKASGVAKP